MSHKQQLSRRDFLRATGAATASAAALGLPAVQALAQDAPPADASATMAIYNFGGDKQQEVYGSAIGRFNERYPNVEVEDIYEPWSQGWGQYITNLSLRIASGLPVDVIALAIEGTRESIFQNLVLPLDDIIADDPVLQSVVEEVHPTLHNALKGPDGATYYMTREWNNMIIHYNPAMFDEAGLAYPDPEWTWDDFLETAKALTSGEGDEKVFGYAIPYFNFGLTPWWHTNGTATLTEDWGDSNLDDPAMLESVSFVHSLVYEHGVSPDPFGTDMTELFVAGRTAMSAAGRWPFTTYIANDFYDVDITPWPNKVTGTTVFGSGGYAVTTTTPNPELAVELIKSLTDFQADLDAVAVGTSLPARESATLNETFNAFPENAHYYFGSLEDIKPVPSPANFSEYENIFMRHLGDIMTNAVSAEEGLAAGHEELSAAMADLRERMEG